MSRHLCGMKEGETLDVCGPLSSGVDWLKYRSANPSGGLLLVSMGTGITPMVQLLREIQTREWGRGKSIRVHVFHAARSPEHVMLSGALAELQALAGKDQLSVHVYMSSAGDHLSPIAVLQRLASIGGGETHLANAFAMVACGTDTFVQTFRDSFADQMTFFAV